MEVLEVSGYVSEEKAVIASRYLGPQAKDASGLADADIQLEPTAVDILIKYYCRESGVRNLKKHIEKVCVYVDASRIILNLLFLDRYIAKLRLNLYRILEKILSLNPNNPLLLRTMLAYGQLTWLLKAMHQPLNRHKNQRQRPTHLWNHRRRLLPKLMIKNL